MLNLLRPEQKKKIIHEYHVRFFVLAFALLLCIQVISIVLLVPSYTTSKIRADAANSQSSILQAQSVSEKVTTLNNLVKKTNDYVSVFVSLPTSTDIIGAINSIVDNRGTVKIKGLVYNSSQNSLQQIIAQGVAPTRQDLLDFVKRLKEQPGVLSATSPLSDFSQAQNINFSVTVVRQPQNI